jgi:hypothetical protein
MCYPWCNYKVSGWPGVNIYTDFSDSLGTYIQTDRHAYIHIYTNILLTIGMSETTVEVQGIELGSVKSECTRERSCTRNSWAFVSAEEVSGIDERRKSIKLLGIDSAIDEWLEWRVKWGQCGVGVCCFITLICYIVSGGANVWLQVATVVFCIITLLFFGMFFYKNVSFVVVKRLLCEPNVIVIVVSTLCNCIIDIGQPQNSFTPIHGILYMLLVNCFVFIDAVKVKSRVLVIVIGSIFALFTIYIIYGYTFGDWNEGVILLQYTTDGKEHVFMKRSTKRSIFLQILLFSMSGVYTLMFDKKQEQFIFVTGNIYRETGTTSKHVEHTQYSMKMKRERVLSTAEKNNDGNNNSLRY